MNYHVIKADLCSREIIVITVIYSSLEILGEGRDTCYLYTYVVHTCNKKIPLAKTYRNTATELVIFNSSCQNIKLFK